MSTAEARAARGKPLEERFAAAHALNPFTGCWEWTGSLDTWGYGRIRIEGRLVQAHRAALMLAGLEVAPGTRVRHRCGVRNCVNPAHLLQVPGRRSG